MAHQLYFREKKNLSISFLFWNPVPAFIGWFGGPNLAHGPLVGDHWHTVRFIQLINPAAHRT